MADKNPKPPDTLYHYTSLNGLCGILTKKNIWATHIQYFNDRSEFIHTTELAEEIFGELLVSSVFNTKIRNIIKSIGKSFHAFANDISRKFNIGIYVTSFSGNGDLLSQWRGYCNSGAGCSIGIDRALLLDIAVSNDCDLIECNYESNQQKPDLRNYITQALDSYSLNKLIEPPNDNMIDDIASNIYKLIARIAPKYKDAAFKEEREWRLVPRELRSNLDEVNFRIGQSSLIPFIEFKLNIIRGYDFGYVPVKEVIIGPSLDKELAKKSLEQLRYKLNIPVFPIKSSLIPFRSSL
jgi:hypothetical protein